MRITLGLFCALAIFVGEQMSYAQPDAPTYQRHRNAAWGGARYSPGWGHPGPVGPAYWGGSYGHAYSGTWYQRPYPYHFDYYRNRFNAPAVEHEQPDCPCAQQ